MGLEPLIYYLLRSYLATLRVSVINEDRIMNHLEEHGRIIVAVWHQRFLPAISYAAKYKHFKLCIMISKSRDGDLIAPIAERIGVEPIRGSSSKGGREALKSMMTALENKPAVAHVVDGPRGPKGIVKPGIIRMAQVSGASIAPLFVSLNRAWVANSWDRFLIPKPLSKVTLRWGEPYFVPQNLDNDSFENHRKEVEDIMTRGYAEDDLKCGWQNPL